MFKFLKQQVKALNDITVLNKLLIYLIFVFFIVDYTAKV